MLKNDAILICKEETGQEFSQEEKQSLKNYFLQIMRPDQVTGEGNHIEQMDRSFKNLSSIIKKQSGLNTNNATLDEVFTMKALLNEEVNAYKNLN